ncbi:MAG: alanyl-tRNA editing protein, partial [Clostridia bacterium]
MTERLYYDDAYRVDFSGTVLDVREDARGFLVQMDRSAFYPTSGGQPYDTGTLGGAQVLDVFVDQ